MTGESIDMTTGREDPAAGALEPTQVEVASGIGARNEASSSYSVVRSIDENLTSLTLIGDIDARAQAELERALEVATDARSRLLLVDVSHADFVSTAAMLALVSAARHVGRVLIYRPNNATQRIFSLIDPEGLCQSIT
jgi:anti-anti-sigma regulatory factor